MSKIIKSERFHLKNVRLSFPSLFTRATFAGEEGEGKYEATFLIDKKDASTKRMVDAAIAKALSDAQLKIPSGKRCIKDGDESEYDGYADNWSFKASSKKRPLTINRDRSPVADDDGVFYAGCYVNAIVDVWIQDNQYGKRVNANMYGVQFVRDGEPFGDSVDVSDEFEAIEDEY